MRPRYTRYQSRAGQAEVLAHGQAEPPQTAIGMNIITDCGKVYGISVREVA